MDTKKLTLKANVIIKKDIKIVPGDDIHEIAKATIKNSLETKDIDRVDVWIYDEYGDPVDYLEGIILFQK